MRDLSNKIWQWIARHKTIWLVAGLWVVVLLMGNYLMIGSYSQYILNWSGEDSVAPEGTDVAIVLGGGIEDGKPRPLLRERLDKAAELLQRGSVSKLLLSGDNRFVDYNEPQVMKDYLIEEKAVNPSLLYLDNAGRSTYETCERAAKVFSLDKVILVSESTHLPRAIYLCKTFGIEAYGVQSDGQASAGVRAGQRWREFLARTKAALNVYVAGERTVLGDKINIR